MRDEFGTRYVLVVPPAMVRHYDPPAPAFGEGVRTKFSSAAFEITEAGKCLALRRDTAAVFHLMRVMEVGIRSVARCLSAPDPTKPAERNWGAILRAINTAITDRRGNWKYPDDAEFFEGVYVSLDKIRNLWRNATMHVEKQYTEEEAKDILEAVRAFMGKLACRLGEDGQPQA
jgi:hypothetical protein